MSQPSYIGEILSAVTRLRTSGKLELLTAGQRHDLRDTLTGIIDEQLDERHFLPKNPQGVEIKGDGDLVLIVSVDGVFVRHPMKGNSFIEEPFSLYAFHLMPGHLHPYSHETGDYTLQLDAKEGQADVVVTWSFRETRQQPRSEAQLRISISEVRDVFQAALPEFARLYVENEGDRLVIYAQYDRQPEIPAFVICQSVPTEPMRDFLSRLFGEKLSLTAEIHDVKRQNT